MAYLLNGLDLFNVYKIRAGHAPSSNISLQGCYDMPKRTGITHKDWGDSDSVEPWVLENEIMFEGRDIVFSGSIQGTVPMLNGYLKTFYGAINAATGLSLFSTPYNSASGYVKSVTPEYMNGGCSVTMTFREPVVSLTGTLPASGMSAYTIDKIPFLSFGLYLSKADTLHDLPELKEQQFTKYGKEGYQIVKRKNKTLDLNGFVIGSSLANFLSKIQALYKVFSSAGTRSIVLNNKTTVVCFATSGFTVDNVILYNTGVIAKFRISLMITAVMYDFITTWQTENAGSATKTIVIPTTGAGYNCWIDWGDGSAEENAVGTPGNITHVYATAGIKTIKIRGTFPRIFFNNAGDTLKLLTIAQWGDTIWSSMDQAFCGCGNLTGTYTDFPNTSQVISMRNMFCNSGFNSPVNFDTSNVTDMYGMFDGSSFNHPVNFDTSKVTNMMMMFFVCSSFNHPVNFDTSKVTNMSGMFFECASFNQPVNFDTSNVTNMEEMFVGCVKFNQSIANFDISKVTTMGFMFADAFKMTTANYDALLISWAAQSVQNNVLFHAGTAQYTVGGAAAAARAHLVLAVVSGGHGWTITDGGTV